MDVEELDPTGHSLERDLCASGFIVEKVKGDKIYAQHLYAALCNNDFTKNEIWPILRKEIWTCSWRHAGGIIADIRDEGNYMDWYCSGIRGSDDHEISDRELATYTDTERKTYMAKMSAVPEAHVTDEIRRDLLKLGWIVVADTNT